MGGSGSGHWLRWDSKKTTESQRWIDIRLLKKHGYLRPGFIGTMSWTNRGQPTGSMMYGVEKHFMVLIYRHKTDDGEWRPVEQQITFDWTACNYGGHRAWFLCPHCHRRVCVLYRAGKYFFCRHCYGLTYACQQETKPLRLLRKAQEIRRRLGASLDTSESIFSKPKNMHWKTFDRLRKEANQASDLFWSLVGQWLGGKSEALKVGE